MTGLPNLGSREEGKWDMVKGVVEIHLGSNCFVGAVLG